MLNDRVTQYALDVVEGKIVTGNYVKLACIRHLNDLEKAKDDDYPFYFNLERANDILEYAESLIIAEGDEQINVKLHGFQEFILGSLNGWVTKKGDYRRFRNSYVQLGRQNGKSFLNGILGTYYGNFDSYKYGQIYCTATKMSQAQIVLNEMIKFINADEDLSKLFKIRTSYNDILCKITNSKIRALGKDTKSIDGFRPYLGIVDELHAHKDNQMIKQLEGGTRKLKQCLISAITTAGFNLNSYCFELYEYCCNVLEGIHNNDSQFIYIAQMDKEDDIWDSKNWIKANPLVCSDIEDLKNLELVGEKAKDIGGHDLKDFMVKALNIWTQFSENQYIEREDLKKCFSDKTLESFRGQKCNIGLDLSSGGDLTSLALIFVFKEDNEKKYFIHSHSFMPSKRLDEHIRTDKAPYDMWKKQGLLTVTGTNGGIKNDYNFIISYLKNIINEYDLQIEQIGYDQKNADVFLYDLDELGHDTVEIYQTCKSLNDATQDLRLEIKSGNVLFNKDNDLLKWSFINAKTVGNGKGNGEIKIDKDCSSQRIDPIDAVIDAYKLAFKNEKLIDYNEMTEDYLKMMGW
ncbi:terminase large subunit [Romboutsia lituseburensis]|uniref:terminase large subunit n=1 Tax=Romboutsia lituseburensis TaxID=1537 RepID=UPI0022EAB9C2|nr:terminase TerL endonuclease subunit [Romboutsia lituseburensis]